MTNDPPTPEDHFERYLADIEPPPLPERHPLSRRERIGLIAVGVAIVAAVGAAVVRLGERAGLWP